MQPKISVYLLKATEFCNLNCSYCFMFNLRDFVYRSKPKVMSLDVVKALAYKMVELAKRQEVEKLTVSIHGGEPLLAGLDWYRAAVDTLRRAGGTDIQFKFVTQTNGILLNELWMEYFKSERITVGISLDGPREVHDKNRINFSGRGSYEEVVRGVRIAQRYPQVFGGVLCVIDPMANGLDIYRHFRALGVSLMDFLLPLEQNWDVPPPGIGSTSATVYADYLIPIFDEWWREEFRTVNIRYFAQLIKNIVGSRGGIDALGGNPVSITSIDSDGSIEPVDSLKACGDGFTQMGINIMSDPLELIYDQPLFQTAIAGQEGLCDQCRACPLHDICGGGYLPHRYSEVNGFDNPTVYCRDLWKLTTHIIDSLSDAGKMQEFFQGQRVRKQEIAPM